jgi:hypothetical protein
MGYEITDIITDTNTITDIEETTDTTSAHRFVLSLAATSVVPVA